jgi:hypothetical protein
MRSFCLLLALLALPSVAEARSDSEFAYPFSRVWTSAVRLLRIDLGCPITEKDKEEGYFFFDYPTDSGPVPGTVELIRMRVRGVEGVKAVVQIAAVPQYEERLVLEKLERKLRAEFGSPLSAEPEKKAKPPADKSEAGEKGAAKEKSANSKREERSGSKKQEPKQK